MKIIIAYLRFAYLLMMTFVMILLSYLIYPFANPRIWRSLVNRNWARLMLWGVGAKIEVNSKLNSEYIQPNTMFIQNHISWLDVLVLSSVHCASYVGKVEMLKWGFLKNIIISGGTVFIDRKNKRELILANQKIAAVLQGGWAMGLFPEGTTSDGKTVHPFHGSIFEAAIVSKSAIVPVSVRYRNYDGSLCSEVTFSKKKWMESVWNTLKMGGFVIKIDILSPVKAVDFPNRDAIASYTHKKVYEVYHSDLREDKVA
ncbi:MAG: lysophospholipid acyltransferase family protein [Burkholderiales bacterium]|nr:lysophospholipid acyltransferase family protein [Burkholderiales bacterium]